MVEQNMVPPMSDQAIEENLGFSGKRKKTENPRTKSRALAFGVNPREQRKVI